MIRWPVLRVVYVNIRQIGRTDREVRERAETSAPYHGVGDIPLMTNIMLDRYPRRSGLPCYGEDPVQSLRESGVASRFTSPDWLRLIETVHATVLPAVLFEPPSDEIVAANGAAARLFGHCPDDLIGRHVSEFFADGASGALDLLAEGSLSGYETRRRLGPTESAVRVWVRMLPVERPRCAVAVLAEQGAGDPVPGELPWGNVVAMGSVDDRLVIAHLTAHITGDSGFDAEQLVGTSLLQLVEPADVAHVLELVTRVTSAQASTATTIRARMRSGRHARWEVVLVPNASDGGYAFTIVAVGERPDRVERALRSSLQLLPAEARTVPVVEQSSQMFNKQRLTKLSSRELQIVTELVNGNRVQAIARKLYLSPGTVRNHLSTSYRKLGVTNQQELIDLLRSGKATSN